MACIRCPEDCGDPRYGNCSCVCHDGDWDALELFQRALTTSIFIILLALAFGH